MTSPPTMLLFLTFLLLHRLGPATAAHCTTTTTTKTFTKCMLLPTQQASIAWTFHPHNATLDVAFSGAFISPSGWVGWGINPSSPEMTGAATLIAFPDPNSGKVVVLPFALDPSVKLQRTPLLSSPFDPAAGLRLLSSSVSMYGGKMATVHDGATVEIYATVKLTSANGSKVHIVWNRGLYVQGYSPTIHPTGINDLSSVSTVDLMSGSAMADQGGSIKTLKIVHGLLNAISWGILLPIGIVTSRYLRHFQSLGNTWFYAHAGIQLTGFSLGTVGFAIGIRLGRVSPGKVYGLHRTLGLAAFCLGGLQTLALLFRPKTTHKYRKYWKSYHHFVGYTCMVLGVVNVFQGFDVMGLNGSYAKLAYCLCLSSLSGLCIAMEVNSWVIFCRKAKEDKMKRSGVISGKDGGCCHG
ncbi:hypothetical protein V2J09_000106 [Rumex salicifolius]